MSRYINNQQAKTKKYNHREHYVLGATPDSLLGTFKATSIKHGQKRHPPQCCRDIMCSATYCNMSPLKTIM